MKSYHKNPRQITERQYKDLEKWRLELGDLSGIVHDLNSDEIVAGNQRGRVFDVNQCEIVKVQEFDEPDKQGTVALGYVVWEGNRYGYRAVRWTERQCEQANIVANRAGGEWDWDVLANKFDVENLLQWGFDEDELLGAGDDESVYTRKIEAPEYEPRGPKPELVTMFNDLKTLDLIEEINANEMVSDAEKEFLRIAAQRHTVLDFEKIADYYAQSGPEMQWLMEGSALVIIDFDKAISQGFVELSLKMAEMVRDEYGDGDV